MFTLAHLSDPHIGPIESPDVRPLLSKRGLGLINWYRKRHRHHSADVLGAIVRDMHAQNPDHIALTGDLVNISLDAEFARAARWLETLGKPHDVTLTPGNHDAYVRRAAGHGALHWAEFMRGDDGADFPFCARRGPVAMIGLTTSLPTGPFMATGRLGGTQLATRRASDRAIARAGVPRRADPPSANANRGHYMKRLIDAPVLRAILADHGAELLLHGHNHEQQLMWLDGPDGRIPAVGVPSASAIVSTHDEPAAYNLYAVGGGPGAWTCDMTVRGYAFGRDEITGAEERRD